MPTADGDQAKTLEEPQLGKPWLTEGKVASRQAAEEIERVILPIPGAERASYIYVV